MHALLSLWGSILLHQSGVNAIKPAPELVTKLSAIGKYPHLTASEDTLDFGEVQMGSQTVSDESFLVCAVSSAALLGHIWLGR